MSGISTGTPRSSSVVAGAGTGIKPCADHVHQRVRRADLVEVHLVAGRAVDFGFRVGQAAEHLPRLLLHPRLQVRGGDHLFHLAQVAVRLLPCDLDPHPGGDEWAPARRLRAGDHAFEPQASGQRLQLGGRPAGGDQRSQTHVAADPGEAIEVADPRHESL